MDKPNELDQRLQEIIKHLEAQHVALFFEYLTMVPQVSIKLPQLWMIFERLFPSDFLGTERRMWLLALLRKAQEEGKIELPVRKGSGWEVSLTPALPLWVRKIREVEEKKQENWRTYAWLPELEWVADLSRLKSEWENFLYQVQQGIIQKKFQQPVPLAYRSIELFGNEKHLEKLTKTSLFQPGRLSLELLGCTTSIPGFPVEGVVQVVSDLPFALVFENKETWRTAVTILKDLPSAPYGIVCIGEGTSFEQSVLHFQSLPYRIERIDYVGDIDRPGLRTAQAASQRAQQYGLPPIVPAPGMHQAMLKSCSLLGRPLGLKYHSWERRIHPDDERLVSWLPEDLRTQVLDILRNGHRIPEEVLIGEVMRQVWR